MKIKHLPQWDKRSNAFSMVEVAISVSIISIGIITLLALLPSGLSSVRSSADKKQAAFAIKAIQSRLIATPATLNNGDYVQMVPGITGANWKIGDSPMPTETLFLNSGGHVEYDSALRHMQMRVDISPPQSLGSAGKATINIAWPHTAIWQNNQWQNARGSLKSTFYFFPRRE